MKKEVAHICMSNKKVAREFFESYMPKDILQITDLNSLSQEKESFIDKDLVEQQTKQEPVLEGLTEMLQYIAKEDFIYIENIFLYIDRIQVSHPTVPLNKKHQSGRRGDQLKEYLGASALNLVSADQ